LNYQGAPLADKDREALEALSGQDAPAKAQAILDSYCLVFVNINPESRVKVHNEAGVTAELRAVSPNAQSAFSGGGFANASDKQFKNGQNDKAEDRWMDMQMYNNQPLKKDLSGLPLEYRIIQIYSRDPGKREAKIAFNVGQGSQDIGYRNDVDILFDAQSTRQ